MMVRTGHPSGIGASERRTSLQSLYTEVDQSIYVFQLNSTFCLEYIIIRSVKVSALHP